MVKSFSVSRQSRSNILPPCTVCLEPNNTEVYFEFCGGRPIVGVMFFLFFYNLVGPDCVRAVLRRCAVLEAEPQDQLTERTLLHVLLLALQNFVVVEVGVSCF